MIFSLNPNSGIPIYLQLMEQIRFGVETGALRPGDQLPGIRRLAESVVMNPNTVAKAYRELEHEGLVELRQGSGAFVSTKIDTGELAGRMKKAKPLVKHTVQRLLALGLTEEEVRRLVEAELRGHHAPNPPEPSK
ncbi:MAG TPA: GntR family transcriptional regulator [Bryobacteraceae bacterium]|mgnify:CR=1 FL=1|nr:GntR family transcriptional regulator [Bryobacteraceae bacterium]